MFRFRVTAAFFLRISLLVGVAGGLLAPAAPVGAENLAIGTLGASFDVEGWQRVKLTDNIGADQFALKGQDSYLFVLELGRFLELRADYEAVLETFMVNMRRRQPELRLEPEMGFERYDPFVRATRRMFVSESGAALFYQLDLISNGDGLAYVFVSWAPETEETQHRAALDEVFDAFRLPGEGTEFYARSRPQPHLLEVGDWKIRLTFADSVLHETEREESVRRTLVGDDENMALHLMLAQSTGAADEVLDEVREVTAEDGSYEEVERGDLDSKLGAGRWLRMRSSGEGKKEIALAVLPLEPGVWLDVRLVRMGEGFRQRLWESLVQSLEVVRPVKVDAYPEPAAVAKEPKYASPAARALFEGSFDGGPAGWEEDLVALAGGGVLQHDGARLERLSWTDGKRSSELLYTFPKFESIEPAAWGDQILMGGDAEVRRVAGGELEPAGFRADRLAPAGESLLIARYPERREFPGLVGLPSVGSTTLFLRVATGAERQVVELAGQEVAKLAARPGEALLAVKFLNGEDPGLAPDSAQIELLRLDLGKGVLTSLGRWFSVASLAVAEGGWLVSGEDADGRQGVFLLRDGGGRELLVTGRAIGLALEAGSLWMRVQSCPAHQGSCYLRSPLTLLAEHGPHLEPFTARQLNAIAAAARQQSGLRDASSEFPATRCSSVAFFATADGLARQRMGSSLPK